MLLSRQIVWLSIFSCGLHAGATSVCGQLISFELMAKTGSQSVEPTKMAPSK